MKLIVFDLDGTLAQLGQGIKREHINMLQELERNGSHIAVCSGKPVYYLCGLMRQAGLKRPILVGENGAVIQIGIDLPPVCSERVPYDAKADRSLIFVRDTIRKKYPRMWFQPNEVAVTPFPQTEEEFAWISTFLRQQEFSCLDVYRHCDSYDIVPAGLDKKTGLTYLGNMLGITPEETVAVGDGVNDYPMFAYAGLALGIGVKEPEKVDVNFGNIAEALQYLLKKTTGG